MPALSDFLGALLSEVTNARLQADLESARIAQLYAAHPLLQHFAVPRFRAPTVNLELPLAVDTVEPPHSTPPTTQELAAVRQSVDAIIEQELGRNSIHLTPSVRKRLTQSINDLFDTLQTTPYFSTTDAVRAADNAVAAVMQAIRTTTADRAPFDPTIESSLQRQLGTEFLKLQRPPARVQVTVVTAKLRDIAPPWALTRIRLSISEQGVEWTQTNPDDSTTRTLLPE
jgi:hypothetical protein